MNVNLDTLRQALAASPGNLPLLLMTGEACLEAFLIEEAKQKFQCILTLAPDHLGAQLGLTRAAYKEGKWSEAILRAEVITAAHPNNGEALRMLSRIEVIEGRIDVAWEHYQAACKAEPGVIDQGLEKEFADAGKSSSTASSETKPRKSLEQTEGEKNDRSTEAGPGTKSPQILLDDLSVDFERPIINFADVGGMAAVKEDIRMKIIYPLQRTELFRKYGKKSGGGVLLYGPPGCGKTMLSRATAGEIRATFLSIGIHQVLDMWLGNSEKNLHQIFELARKNTPSILFFDEVDALASDRTSMKHGAGRNVINQFLAEMDGAIGNNDGILVLGATNAPWQVDSAFRRPGRFDRVVFVPPPDETARASIIELIAKDKPIHKLDACLLAKRTKDFSGADLGAIFDVASQEKLLIAMREDRVVPITMDDLLRAAKSMQPSTRSWFENAKNYALYANQSGFYDDVLSFLGLKQ